MSSNVNRDESDVDLDVSELDNLVCPVDIIPLLIVWKVFHELQYRELRFGVCEELSKEQRSQDFHKSRISFHYPEEMEDYPGIYCRIGGKVGPESELIVYLLGPASAFYEASFSFSTGKAPAEVAEHWAGSESFQAAVEMMLAFIDHLHSRADLMIHSYIRETIESWWSYNELQIGSKRRRATPLYNTYGIGLREALKIYIDDVEWRWGFWGDERLYKMKIRLAVEYDILASHWRMLFKMVSEGNENWKEYVKAGKFADTPDDLLGRLWDVDRSSSINQKAGVSELALRHAARRVGLVRFSGVTRLSRVRGDSAKPRDYSASQLYQFLHEGRLARVEEEKYGWLDRVWADYPEPEGESRNMPTPEDRLGGSE